QNPVGYAIENGRAVMTSFLALVTNPNLPYQFLHVLAAGISTAGFIVLGFSAWHLLRKKEGDVEFFQKAFRWAAVYALIGTVMVGLVGDAHGKFLGQTQPMKISAAEAIWENEQPAAFVVIANIDQQAQTNTFELRIPRMLSFLLYNNFEGEVEGLKELQAEAVVQYGPGNYIPSVVITFWSFRIMVGVGVLMGLLALLAVIRSKVKSLEKSRLFLKILLPAMALPYLASTFGWILTESDRQPWIVYGLQKVQDAVSPNVTTGDVLFSLILFTVLLGALVAVTGWLMYKSGTAEPTIENTTE
ncbi:MAG TPA: cytochrome ubiquinol oxidase subunit I, partial [Anaerolineales bacterium]